MTRFRILHVQVPYYIMTEIFQKLEVSIFTRRQNQKFYHIVKMETSKFCRLVKCSRRRSNSRPLATSSKTTSFSHRSMDCYIIPLLIYIYIYIFFASQISPDTAKSDTNRVRHNWERNPKFRRSGSIL